MNDYEARRERRERERKAGLAFTRMLRERLEAERIPIEALMESEELEASRGGQRHESSGSPTT